jgi:hypothetical protein
MWQQTDERCDNGKAIEASCNQAHPLAFPLRGFLFQSAFFLWASVVGGYMGNTLNPEKKEKRRVVCCN